MSIDDREYIGGYFAEPDRNPMSDKQRADHDAFMKVMQDAVAAEARAIAQHNERVGRWILNRTLPKVLVTFRYCDWPQRARMVTMRLLLASGLWKAPLAVSEHGALRGYYIPDGEGNVQYVAYHCKGCEVCNGS